MTNFQEIGMAELSRIEGGTCIPPYNPDPNPFPTALRLRFRRRRHIPSTCNGGKSA